MKLLLTALMLFSAFSCFSQGKEMKTYFLKNDGRYVTEHDSADYLRIVSEPDSGSVLYNILELYLNGKKKLVGKSSQIDPPLIEGQCATFYKNGVRQSTSSYTHNALVGRQEEFYPNGKLYLVKNYPDTIDHYTHIGYNFTIEAEYDSTGTAWVENGNGYYKGFDGNFLRVTEEGTVKNGKKDGLWKGRDSALNMTFAETYKDDSLISGVATYKDGVCTYSKTRGTVPEFKGGVSGFIKYLSDNTHYPRDERRKRIQGRVIVSFIVEKDGKIDNVVVKESVSPNLDKEAVRVIKNSPLWTPGKRFGRPVRVSYSVPLNFILTN